MGHHRVSGGGMQHPVLFFDLSHGQSRVWTEKDLFDPHAFGIRGGDFLSALPAGEFYGEERDSQNLPKSRNF